MVTFNYKTDLKADSRIDESQPKEMCGVIQCPVCDSQLVTQTASKMLSDGQHSEYFTVSSYYSHIKNVHLRTKTKKQPNAKLRKTESSSSRGKKSKENSKVIKHKQKRRSRSQSEEESEEISSSDSEDDINIENEMNENFQINSDLDVDSDTNENSSTQYCDLQQARNIVSRSTNNDRPGKIF